MFCANYGGDAIVYSLSPLQQFFADIEKVSVFISGQLRTFLQVIYNNGNWNFLFYTALLPFVLMFCVDLIFTFILSIRSKRLILFNILSPKSWKVYSSNFQNNRLSSVRYSSLGDVKNNSRSFVLYHFRLSPLIYNSVKYKKAKAGDVIRCKDGERFTYVGMRLDAKNGPLYAYRSKSGVYYSTMSPSKWSKANGSARGSTIKVSYKNKK